MAVDVCGEGAMAEYCNALVVGAGAVGASVALGLAQQGREVVLVEAVEPRPCHAQSDYDLRVFALSLASEAWLEHLGVWKDVLERRYCSYSDMRVWDAESEGQLHFDRQDVDRRHLGHIVENAVLVDALCSAAKAHPRIQWLCPERVESVSQEMGKTRVWLEGGTCFESDLLVAADGARSSLRDKLDIGVQRASYAQRGIVAMVKTERAHQHTAWQRFLSTGPLALLPLSNGQCSIVWSADDDLAEHLLSMDDETFKTRLSEASECVLGDVLETTQRLAFPLVSQHAERYAMPGIALVGDAAHVIHPLAGQGVNLGFMDAATLIDVLEGESRAGVRTAALRRYARRRRYANQIMQSGMTALYHAFGQSGGYWNRLRGQGMSVVSDIDPLRRRFARQAAGLDGDIPHFLQPHTR
ncbi:protein VisC [gamma proteobacterium HTCC5015]|nr:protein VisC [gamma proteobacterium HTCC5015]